MTMLYYRDAGRAAGPRAVSATDVFGKGPMIPRQPATAWRDQAEEMLPA